MSDKDNGGAGMQVTWLPTAWLQMAVFRSFCTSAGKMLDMVGFRECV